MSLTYIIHKYGECAEWYRPGRHGLYIGLEYAGVRPVESYLLKVYGSWSRGGQVTLLNMKVIKIGTLVSASWGIITTVATESVSASHSPASQPAASFFRTVTFRTRTGTSFNSPWAVTLSNSRKLQPTSGHSSSANITYLYLTPQPHFSESIN